VRLVVAHVRAVVTGYATMSDDAGGDTDSTAGAGAVASGVPSTGCITCPTGQYQHSSSSSSCINCGAGTRQLDTGLCMELAVAWNAATRSGTGGNRNMRMMVLVVLIVHLVRPSAAQPTGGCPMQFPHASATYNNVICYNNAAFANAGSGPCGR
jgi:hypothetical protein